MLGRWKKKLIGPCKNILGNWKHDQLVYVTEESDWVIKEIGLSITKILNSRSLVQSVIHSTYVGVRNQIVHFASVNTFFTKSGWQKPHRSNKVIVTWFHILRNDEKLFKIVEAQKDISILHTACQSTKMQLIEAGVDPQKIVVIPLGVDTKLLYPGTHEEKNKTRERLGIPKDRIVIGSFQKDGNGWGEGLEPKLIKGPDIFVETVARLKIHNPFVLLVGPARGYMKKELEKRGIEYKHIQFKNFEDVPRMFHALDLYIIASRIEGGPKAILESWATGVPVVSTKVGLVPDIGTDGQDVLLADVEDVDRLAELSDWVLSDQDLRQRLINNGFESIRNYTWEKIAQRYYDEIYSRLI